MIPPELFAWLAQPADFAAGAALYAQLGGSPVYQQLFAAGTTGYSRQVLRRELQALASNPAPPAPMAPAPAVSKPAPVPAPAAQVTTHVDAPDLPVVRAQLRALRDERSQLHAQLTALGRKARGAAALRILDIGDEVTRLLKLEDHVLAHGQLPAGPVALADITDEGELRRRLSNLVALRAKLRKNEKRAGELPGVEADIDLIRTKLNRTTRV
ncbi:hypothetical protein [Hymenobacter chitinivorans]|uniref:Uncharacterized protein n=1 Tax=Hymenobacter chitinivorans DSM 11115 TaxID=1121954 RepID=A0A2M9BNB9_9BACT|nr:hypothetical protein [Hymenobacter chitinivorans]PJJ59434.1 hypothetical protein CLV45_0851 [Hymenobacter chitinivorans DSM 11115]